MTNEIEEITIYSGFPRLRLENDKTRVGNEIAAAIAWLRNDNEASCQRSARGQRGGWGHGIASFVISLAFNRARATWLQAGRFELENGA
jgi:hypothetical protein